MKECQTVTPEEMGPEQDIIRAWQLTDRAIEQAEQAATLIAALSCPLPPETRPHRIIAKNDLNRALIQLNLLRLALKHAATKKEIK